ncbi:hypothetical protein GW17_00040113 [Ensete ventricosum]|nr:hypothetical protein GW17_00040113 [Ensete ventricosum]
MRLLPLAREAVACAASAARGYLHMRPSLDTTTAYVRPTQCLPGPSAASLTLLICTHTRCYLQEHRLSDLNNAEISICKRN